MYGYDTKITKYFAGPTNTNSIHSHGKDLLSSLTTFRKLDSPLILIAHSLGGIVVKEMLASSSSSTDDTRQNVVASTAGVIFLGTPHRGSADLATLGDRARSMINVVRMKTNPALLDALRLKTNDLERAQESFSAVWSRYDFRVKTFQEGLGLTGLDVGLFGKKVVPDYSSLLGDVRERAETIQANHMEMCRFTGLDDPNYGRICGEISSLYYWIVELGSTKAIHLDRRFWANHTLTEPRESRAGEMDEREQSCLQSLTFPNMNQRTQNLENPAEGTCAWLFKHEAFIDWFDHKNQDRPCGLLWLRGKPGSGKSTLLKEASLRAREKSDSECHVVSFFFNAKGDSLEHSPSGMLRSILHQICFQNTTLLNTLMDFVQRRRTLSGGDMTSWEEAELKSFFKTAVVGHDKRIIIFVDAIDECDSASIRDVVDFWRDVTKIAHSARAQLSVCLSSRHYPAISVNDCPEIIMESHNHSDIVEFVRRRLDLGMTGKDTDQQAIQKKILEKSGGVFLWVSLVVKDVLRKHDEGKGLRLLLKHLDSVPRELGDLFCQLLTAQQSSNMVVRMFQWALLPTKQLRLHEWHHILAFIGDKPPSSLCQWQQSDFYTETDEQLEKRITHLSRGLLGFNIRSSGDDSHEPADESKSDRAGAGSLDLNIGETRVVQVIHESVRQYFMEGPGFAVLNPASAEKPLAYAHLSIMNICLDYMLIEELDALVEARKLAQRRAESRPAMNRAASVASFGSAQPRAGTHLARENSLGSASPLLNRTGSVSSFGSAPAWAGPHIASAINFDIVRRTRDRTGSVASFSSASSHDGNHTPVEPETHHSTYPEIRKRLRQSGNSFSIPPSSERSDENLLAFRNLEKLKGSAKDQDLASSWVEDQSVKDQAYCDETASLSDPQTSIADCSQVLEAHPALLSYATFELFTHAREADAEGLDPSQFIRRLRDGAWDRWKALREDVGGWIELLYFAADMGWPSWLMADHIWKRCEVISSMKLAIENENSEALGKLLHTFPLEGYTRETSGMILGFLAWAWDAGPLHAYLSEHPAQEHDPTPSIISVKDILASKDEHGRTALHHAVIRQNEASVSVLLKHGADVSAVDNDGFTPLHEACRSSSLPMVSKLLDHRSPVNAVGLRKRTPLHIACCYSTVEIVEELLRRGADPTLRVDTGNTPLHHATIMSTQQVVETLLSFPGTSLEAMNDEGSTPLHTACYGPLMTVNTESEMLAIIRQLLARGAQAHTVRDRSGNSAADVAGQNCFWAALELMGDEVVALPLEDYQDESSA